MSQIKVVIIVPLFLVLAVFYCFQVFNGILLFLNNRLCDMQGRKPATLGQDIPKPLIHPFSEINEIFTNICYSGFSHVRVIKYRIFYGKSVIYQARRKRKQRWRCSSKAC